MPSAEDLIFLNENFGFGLISEIRLLSYSGHLINKLNFFLAYNTNLNYRNEMVMQLCTLCRRYFPGSTCLHMHQKTHHKTRLNDDIILKCSYCSGVFREQGSLEEHVRFFHLEEECLICGHVSVGAFESYEHIGEFHSPLYIPGNIL